MRQFSNEQGGKPSGGKPGPSRSGGYNRENREHKSGGGGYRGGNRSGGGYERKDRPARSGAPRPYDSRPRGGAPQGSGSYRGESGGEGYKGRPMSSWVEVTGRTVEEATEEASKRFNVGKHDLKIDVVEQGSKGFLGIGSKPAKVKVALKASALQPFAAGVLSRMLQGMDLPDKVKTKRDADGNAVLNIEGPSSATLIGRHGFTLESLQYLVSKIVQRVTGDDRIMIIVDVEGYLDRQRDKLKELALSMADKAKETGVEVPMRPMGSKERRVVHMALKDHAHVITESRGEGLRRKVVIVPKVKAVPPAPQAAPEPGTDGRAPEMVQESGTVAPEVVVVEPADEIPEQAPTPVPEAETVSQPEPGNAAPKPANLDDSIGNKA